MNLYFTDQEAEILYDALQRDADACSAKIQEAIRQQMRTTVLATIDELHQYLNGNVTLEAATDSARELTHQLNERW
tara:strand:- start:331 stop:558 length:228 start_codon:yes stop_codon:yes gene_type:complete